MFYVFFATLFLNYIFLTSFLFCLQGEPGPRGHAGMSGAPGPQVTHIHNYISYAYLFILIVKDDLYTVTVGLTALFSLFLRVSLAFLVRLVWKEFLDPR